MRDQTGRCHAYGKTYKIAGIVTVHVLQELLAGLFHSVKFDDGITK
jgi:hypothetical protein